MQFNRRVYPVNPRHEELFGLKCYGSILEVERGVDFSVIVVPARIVPEVMEECGEKGG